MASVGFITDSTRRAACEALADEIVSRIPVLAEARGLPTVQVALAAWLALFCDLIGTETDESKVRKLFQMARRAIRVGKGK